MTVSYRTYPRSVLVCSYGTPRLVAPVGHSEKEEGDLLSGDLHTHTLSLSLSLT